jgi:hypothetical protein
LRFKEIDWKKSLERPFLINYEVSPQFNENQLEIYFPAKLFNNTEITAVYYKDMKSSDVELIEGEKRRIKVRFDRGKHEIKSVPYKLEIDQAVIVIAVSDIEKVIRMEDIRVPFYHKED